jgi:hypothetical protein
VGIFGICGPNGSHLHAHAPQILPKGICSLFGILDNGSPESSENKWETRVDMVWERKELEKDLIEIVEKTKGAGWEISEVGEYFKSPMPLQFNLRYRELVVSRRSLELLKEQGSV